MSAAARLIAAAISLVAVTGAAQAATCKPDTFEGARYSVCSVDLSDPGVKVRMFWQDASGSPYASFPKLVDDLSAQGLDLVFAMNGGMFADDFSPLGLYVEGGRELADANTANVKPASGPVPNFYKKPNGVFFIGNGRAGVMETGRFLAEKPAADFATQSGPLLVIDGEIHPAFIVGSNDRKRRNGVGVCSPTKIYFAISDDAVNFHDFARYFRDRLGCRDALFLDGGRASGLYSRELARIDWSGHGGYGPIIGVVRAAE